MTRNCLLLPLLLAVPAVAQPWQPEVFPIGFWCGPPAQYNTLASYQTIKDCNFTWVMGGYYDVAETRKMLDYCQQLGLKALVQDGRVAWQQAYADDLPAVIRSVVADYGSHPALYGYFIRDEPSSMIFPALGKVSQELQRQDPRHLPYINLFPTYASPEQLGTPDYDEHLARYLEVVKPAVLSYDHYCLRADGSDGPDYFENLGLAREHSLRTGVPAWNIIQAMSFSRGVRQPNAAEMRWQVYTSLAYGFKGIMYFVYWSYNDNPQDVGIVDHLGQPAKLYAPVSQLNAEMKALGPTLLGLTSTGVYHTGSIPAGGTRLGTDRPLRLPDDKPLVIGFFRGKTAADQYAMVVNRSHSEPVDFPLTWCEHVTGLAEVSPKDGTEVPLKLGEKGLPVHLEPGDGRLYRLTTVFTYPVPPEPAAKIDFAFDRDGDLEGWGEQNGMDEPVVKDGVLTMAFTGNDPYIHRNWLRLAPDQYTKIRVRMKLPKCDATGQLFWTTAAEPLFSDTRYLAFPVQPDGQWHEYEIPVATHALWKGQRITAIRLDPTTGGITPGTKVEIDWVRGE